MSPGQLEADPDRYREAAAANTPPPQITSDSLVAGTSPIEQLLRVLGLAVNLGDEQDNTENDDEHRERDARTADAADEFAAQDEHAAAEMKGVAGQDPSSQMAQQIPQLASGIAGALGGALGSVMQPIAQIPQQLAQGAQQAMQAGMGLSQQAGAAGIEDTEPIGLADFGGSDYGDYGDLPGGATPGGGGGITPAAVPAPPPPPSAGTFASSVRPGPSAPAATAGPATAPGGGMTGVPMVPPAAMNGAVDGSGRDAKTDTKRISVPAVRNGGAVQGRIVTPLVDTALTAGTAATKVQGKPVATRRIIVSRNGDPEAGDQAAQP